MAEIPLGLDDITPEWLADALAQTDLLGGENVGMSFTKEKIGEGAGFLGDVARLTPRADGAIGELPDSMIVKIPTATVNRRMGQMLGVYEREIRFYRELGPALPIRIPRHLYSAMDASDPEQAVKALRGMNRLPLWLVKALIPVMSALVGRQQQRYVLLLEDLAGFRIGDQIGGCSVAEAGRALATLARFHAVFYDRAAELGRYPWIIPLDLGVRFTKIMIDRAKPQFRRTNAEWMSAEDLALLDWLDVHEQEFTAAASRLPYTVLHGDYRLDNVCFDDATGDVIVFDWQTVLQGPLGFDVAYFLSAWDGEAGELETLVEHYRVCLADEGVDLSPQQMRYEYEIGLLGTIGRLMVMGSQELEFGDGRGKELTRTWLQRTFAKAVAIDRDELRGQMAD